MQTVLDVKRNNSVNRVNIVKGPECQVSSVKGAHCVNKVNCTECQQCKQRQLPGYQTVSTAQGVNNVKSVN